MVNPFHCQNSTDLLNIATGEKAPSTDLADAQFKGVQAILMAEQAKFGKI